MLQGSLRDGMVVLVVLGLVVGCWKRAVARGTLVCTFVLIRAVRVGF